MSNPKQEAFTRTYHETGDARQALDAYDAAPEGSPSEPSPGPSILDRNPHRRPGDPTFADYGALAVGEMDELDELDPGLAERVFKAAAWDERRAAENWRTEKEARRARAHEEIAGDAAKTEAYIHEQDVERFRVRYWQLSSDQRIAEAERLGIDHTTFEPPEHPFGS